MLTSLLLSLIDENDKTCWGGETFTDIESRKCESNILWTRKCESNKERLSQKVAKWPKGKIEGLEKLKEPHTEQGFDIGVQVHMPLLSLPPSLKRVDKSYPKQWNSLPDDRAIECQK